MFIGDFLHISYEKIDISFLIYEKFEEERLRHIFTISNDIYDENNFECVPN